MILITDFRRQWHERQEDVLAAVAAVGESDVYKLGGEVATLELTLDDDGAILTAERWRASRPVPGTRDILVACNGSAG